MISLRSIFIFTIFSIIAFLCIFFAKYINLHHFFSFPLSSLTLSLLLGIIIGNFFSFSFLGKNFGEDIKQTISFSSKTLLRIGIIFFGFSITLSDIIVLGITPLLIAFFVIFSTLTIGILIGKKILGMDTSSTLLISSGSAICGASAILATETTFSKKSNHTSVAVAIITLFGIAGMILFPLVYSFFTQSDAVIGLALGGTIHDVAQVVASASSISEEVTQTALLVKMTRVLLLTPVLLIFIFYFQKTKTLSTQKKRPSDFFQFIPPFIFAFLLVIVFHSFVPLPEILYSYLSEIKTFLFTLALFALGLNTQFSHFKQGGGKSFVLAFILFIWLMICGIGIILMI